MKRVLSKSYDVMGHGILRLIKLAVIGKGIPIGNLRGGPGVRCLAVLGVLHYFGYPLYWVNAKYGQHLGLLRSVLGRLQP